MAYQYPPANMPVMVNTAPVNVDDADRPVNEVPKVFVGQVSPNITEPELRALFSRYGPLASCEIVSSQGVPQGFAMVVFETWAAAETAIEYEHGSNSLGPDTRLVVRFADPPRGWEMGAGKALAPKKLFVGQISPGCKDAALRELFQPYGTIHDIYILQTGCAFIKYDRWAEAEQAMTNLNGSVTMEGAKCPLVVRWAEAKKGGGSGGIGVQRATGGFGKPAAAYGARDTKRLFCGQLPPQVTEPTLREMFQVYGNVTDIYILDKGSNPWCAFIEYNDPSEAASAASSLNGSTTMTGATSPLVVRLADARPRDRTGMKRSGADDGSPGAKRVAYGGMPTWDASQMGMMMHPMMGMGMWSPMAYPAPGAMGAMPGMQPAMQTGMQPAMQTGMQQMQPAMQQTMQPAMQPAMQAGMQPQMTTMPGMDGQVQQQQMAGQDVNAANAQQMGMMPQQMAGQAVDASGMQQMGMMPQMGMIPQQNMAMGQMGMMPQQNMQMGGMMPQQQTVAQPDGKGGMSQAPGPGVGHKLFVGQLPYQSTENDVVQLLSQVGSVMHVHILTRPDGLSRGCGFAVMADRDAAEAAITNFNGVAGALAGGEGRPLVVKYADNQ